jgi:multiple sugar transport system permease protein
LEALSGYLFILPAAVVLGMFGLFPLLFNVYISLFNWRIRRSAFVGLGNYNEIFGGLLPFLCLLLCLLLAMVGLRLLAREKPSGLRGLGLFFEFLALAALGVALPLVAARGDRDLLNAFRVTVWYTLGTVPIQLVLGFALAAAIHGKFKGREAFRVVMLLPYIVPAVATAAVFERLFSLQSESWANQVLACFGLRPLQWLREYKGVFQLIFGFGPAGKPGGLLAYWSSWAAGPSLSLTTIMIYNVWVYVGYYALIFANGLAAIPLQYYEVAALDGASPLTVLRKVTLPLVSPSTYFLAVLGVIGTFKSFNSIYVLRDPAAGGASDPMSVSIFFQFFRGGRFGYAAAQAMVLLAMVVGLTLWQRRVMEKQVYYG